MYRKPRIREWTPPIFGWQYPLYWEHNGDEIRVSSWNQEDWGDHPRYFVWVTGSALGKVRMYWSVFFSIPHPAIRVHILAQNHSLTKAIDKMEKQVLLIERGIFYLRAHSKMDVLRG